MSAPEDAQHRAWRIWEQQNANTIRGTEGTGEFERYTPAEYIAAARQVLGAIDLDPASCAEAQQTVRAKKFFTAETNGLDHEWYGKVWLNPPYHRELGLRFIDKLVEEFKAGRTTEAVMLTNNSTDSEWFVLAGRACHSVCFTHDRVTFSQPNGKAGVRPTQGQAFFYFGNDPARFENVFCNIGECWRPSRFAAGAS